MPVLHRMHESPATQLCFYSSDINQRLECWSFLLQLRVFDVRSQCKNPTRSPSYMPAPQCCRSHHQAELHVLACPSLSKRLAGSTSELLQQTWLGQHSTNHPHAKQDPSAISPRVPNSWPRTSWIWTNVAQKLRATPWYWDGWKFLWLHLGRWNGLFLLFHFQTGSTWVRRRIPVFKQESALPSEAFHPIHSALSYKTWKKPSSFANRLNILNFAQTWHFMLLAVHHYCSVSIQIFGSAKALRWIPSVWNEVTNEKTRELHPRVVNCLWVVLLQWHTFWDKNVLKLWMETPPKKLKSRILLKNKKTMRTRFKLKTFVTFLVWLFLICLILFFSEFFWDSWILKVLWLFLFFWLLDLLFFWFVVFFNLSLLWIWFFFF